MEIKEIAVMVLAIVMAILMGYNPKFYVRNPSRQTKTYLKRVSSIGKAVAIVLIVGFAVMLFKSL